MSLQVEAIRWFVKSVAGFLAGMALLAFWVELVGIRPEFALVLNHGIISIGAYMLTDQWVFQAHGSPSGLGHVRQYISFQAVMLSSALGKYVLFLVLLWLGSHYLIAWTVGAVTLFVFSFAGNRYLWSDQCSQYSGA